MYDIDAFDGGLNNKYEPNIIDNNESPDCANVEFDDLGAVATRGGTAKLNTTSVGSFSCDGLFTTRFNDGSETMVAWFGGTMYTLGGTSTFTTAGSAQSVYTAGTRVNYAMYQNLAFFGNGQQPYKYNGAEFTRHGVDAPNSTPTVNTSSAGTLADTYKYKITYVNSFVVQGDLSSNTTAITLASERVNLTSLPIAPASFGVEARRIYRTAGLSTAASSSYFLVTEIEDNTTTSYEDNKDDAELGVAAPTDNGVPPDWHLIHSFQERLFFVDQAVNPQYLWYSDLGEPFTVASTNFIKISDGDGESIRGISSHANTLVIYKDASIWLIYMPDTSPANWIRIKSNSKYGGSSHRCIVDYSDVQLFLGKRHDDDVSGFYAFTGTATEPDSTGLRVAQMYGDAKSDRIEPDTRLFQSAYLENASGIRYQNKIWIALTYGTGITANNRIYQFDFQRRSESRRQGSWVPFTGLAPADFTIYDEKLYYGTSADTGFVYEMNDGTYNDDGAAIDSYYNTKEFDGPSKDLDQEKDFRYSNFTCETLGDWDMGITYKIDSDKGTGNRQDINLDPGSTLWGTGSWGDDTWGGGVSRKNFKVELGTSVGKKISFKFDNRNTADQGFKVIRGNFYYNRRGLR
jgi:hypothetical protein